MQFSCESCKTQLQIADEKLRGKRLIVRCKKCGAKIALADPAFLRLPPRVDPPAAKAPAAKTADTDLEATRAMESDVLEKALQALKQDDVAANGSPPTERFAAPPVAPPVDPAIWFAMLQGKQTGPLTREEVEEHADEGAVGPRTYLWREGMDAWQRAKDIPELAELFPQLPPPAPRPGPQAAEPKPEPAPAATAEPSSKESAARETGAQHPSSPVAPAPAGTAKPETAAASRPAPPVVQRSAPMFESAAPARPGGPFAIFLVLLGLATAATVLFIVLGAGAGKKSDPATTAAIPAPPAAAGLTAEQVRRKLDEHKPALQGCVDDALRRDPNLRVGQIHVATTIAPTGEVTDARIDRQNVDESPLGACLKRATKQIVFPRFSGSAFDVDIPISVSAGD